MRLDISHILDWTVNRIGKENIAYIVMSEKTKHDLAIGRDGACNYRGGSGYYLKYHDVPIALCEKLSYGEVEFVKLVKEGEEI